MAYDLAIVGAGICGLAHALAAARRGKRVVVIDRDAAANGASVRNFGFVTVTGQQAGECWRRAMRSRDVWAEVAPQAGIATPQRGLLMVARRPEALAVLEAFAATRDGRGLPAAAPGARSPTYGEGLRTGDFAGALYSPHEIRVESREAIPKLAAWLAEAPRRDVPARDGGAHRAAPPRLETSRGDDRGRGGRRLPRRRFPRALRRPHRRLRPDPLQAAHDAAGARALRRAAAGGDVGPGSGALSRLCRTAAGARR